MTEKIEVEILPWLSRALGKESKLTLTEKANSKGEKLKSLLKRIALKYEGFGAVIYDVKRGVLQDTVVIFVNNKPIAKDLKITVKSGDKITLTPFYSGG
jgi:molybdopterin converting factor small subunit